METVHEPLDGVNQKSGVARREFLRLGAIGGAAVAAGAVATTWMPGLRQRGLLSADGVFDAASIAWADSLYKEVFPTSPLILNPFSDELTIPKAMIPEDYGDWSNWSNAPGSGDGQPNVVRFINQLDDNPDNLDRQDFGAPDYSFLIHLHNAHTAPESDGQPHYSMNYGPKNHGYKPGMWVDNLYLNWPAGNDEREKQSFFWFHDHRMDHTGANVYKGLVGLYPIYDPIKDFGDETNPAGLRLPGRRRNRGDGSFDVEYDIPLAFYDCRLDDGITLHRDMHDLDGDFPAAKNPAKHPEWWGKTFFKHFPNHGFVGDIFTVNGTAYPTLEVKRRKYRFRFLDASVARIYDFKLMSSTQGPKTAVSLGYTGDDLDGQYRIPDA